MMKQNSEHKIKMGSRKNLKRAIVLLVKDSPAMIPLTVVLSAMNAAQP